jgi:2-methylcitrate dehydratase PrpD
MEHEMTTPAQQLSAFTHDLTFADIPSHVRDAAKRALVDTVGVGLAAQEYPFAGIVTDVMLELGGTPEATVLGNGTRLSAPNAIIANGNLMHGLDYDNTHAGGLMHPGACVVPTALAVAEKTGADGEALLLAIVVGHEAQGRIAAAAATKFHARGFHPTFITGSFASALTAGKLLGLDAAQLTHALGICGTQASGTFEWLQDGSWAKRFGPGWAGSAGTLAALLAQRGYTGPATIFEGRFGLYRNFVGDGNYSLERLVRGLGTEWETVATMYKRYPCCHANHGAINAARALMREGSFSVADIEAVECRIQPDMARMVGEPVDVKRRPLTPYQAQFSIYYDVALAFLQGMVDLDDFVEERLNDPDVLALADRIVCTPEPQYSGVGGYPATVTVTLKDGRTLRHEDPGDLVNPMSDDEVDDKFRRNAGRSLPPEQVEDLLAAMRGAGPDTDVRALMALSATRAEALAD